MRIGEDLVRDALNATIRELGSIDLSEEDAESIVDCCDLDEVAKVLTKYLQNFL